MTLGYGRDSFSYLKSAMGLWSIAVAFGPLFQHERGRLIRFTVESPRRWRMSGESRTLFSWPSRNMDSPYSFRRGFHIGRVFEWRNYRRVAKHVSFGPLTISLVRGTWVPTCKRGSITF